MAAHPTHHPPLLHQQHAHLTHHREKSSTSSLPAYADIFAHRETYPSSKDNDSLIKATVVNHQRPAHELEASDPSHPTSSSSPTTTQLDSPCSPFTVGPSSSTISLGSEDEPWEDPDVRLDRMLLKSSSALATAQVLLSGSLGVRGALYAWNERDAEGTDTMSRIEIETRRWFPHFFL